MNAMVEVATATVESNVYNVLAIARTGMTFASLSAMTPVVVATSTVVSIGGTSISAVSPDHINYDWRTAEAA